MKKIMFNDRYGLTQAVLNGTKTMTRRIIPEIWVDFPRSGRQKANIRGLHSQVLIMDFSHVLGEDCLYPADSKYQPKYYKGEEVAVARSYGDIYVSYNDCLRHEYSLRVAAVHHNGDLVNIPGWNNKMFVKANLMPDRIRITNIKLERLQDISDEDCIREGICNRVNSYTFDDCMRRIEGIVLPRRIYAGKPREAFAALIDRISGKGTWESNPYVYVYEFELVEEGGER